MENKSVYELTLSFWLTAALCLQATVIENNFYCPSKKMDWTDARTYCQKNYTDLVTWDTVNPQWLTGWLEQIPVKQIWIGLHRDPENNSVWKWVDIRTGNGITGDDVSQSSYWAEGQPDSFCAFVSSSLTLYSDECSSMHSAYCSEGEYIQYYDGNFTWSKANQLCQKNHSYLAIITNTNKDNVSKAGWIGLYQEAYNKWSWIKDQTFSYNNWAPGEPIVTDCGSFNVVSGKWHSSACSKKLKFVCYSDNLVLVNENKTWEEAVEHCRGMTAPCDEVSRTCVYHHQLLSLQYSEDIGYVRDRIYSATTDEVWTGLRFLGGQWWWLNGEAPQDQGELPECPSQERCGTLSKYNTNSWIVRDCSEKRNFVCLRYKI